MSTALKVLGAIVLLAIVGFGGLLYCAHQAGSGLQDDFFGAATSGDVDKLMARLHPDLRKKVERPVIEAWMTALTERLGAYKGMKSTDFSTSIDQTSLGKEVKSEATVEFEKGEARSLIRSVDDLVTVFDVKSPEMPDASWLARLKDTSPYEERALAFLRALVSADADAALGMMHPDLRKTFEASAFAEQVAKVKARFGADTPMRLLSARFDPDAPGQLFVRYTVRDSAERVAGKVRFELRDMGLHIMGFALPEM